MAARGTDSFAVSADQSIAANIELAAQTVLSLLLPSSADENNTHHQPVGFGPVKDALLRCRLLNIAKT